MLTSEDEKTLYVADTFGDSIAMIPVKDLKTANPAKSIARIPLGLQPQLSSSERGERFCSSTHALGSSAG